MQIFIQETPDLPLATGKVDSVRMVSIQMSIDEAVALVAQDNETPLATLVSELRAACCAHPLGLSFPPWKPKRREE